MARDNAPRCSKKPLVYVYPLEITSKAMLPRIIKHYLTVFAVGSAVLAACSKEDLMIDPDRPLVGTWVQTGYEESAVVYTRSSRLKDDGPGMVIQADGRIVLRGIAGWCATPPVGYVNYDGRWSTSGFVLRTIVDYQWLPEASVHEWEIVSVDEKRLVLLHR